MKFHPGKPLALTILLCSSFTSSFAQVSPEEMERLTTLHRETLQFHTYMTANQVIHLGADEVAREKSVRVFRGMGIQKIILEVYRSGTIPTDETLITLRDFYSRKGFGIMAGIATVPGVDFGVPADRGLGWFNWQSEKTQRDLEKVVRRAARIFDIFIVDDFLCSGTRARNRSKHEEIVPGGSIGWIC